MMKMNPNPAAIAAAEMKNDEREIQMRERYEQRLFRILAEAGHPPIRILTITPEELVEVPGITVPNIRAVLCVQNKLLSKDNNLRAGRRIRELLKEQAGQTEERAQ